MGAGSGGWEGPGCFFSNVRLQPKGSVFNQLLWNEEGGQGCWDTGIEGDTVVPYSSPASSAGVRGYGTRIITYWNWKGSQWTSPLLLPSPGPGFSD